VTRCPTVADRSPSAPVRPASTPRSTPGSTRGPRAARPFALLQNTLPAVLPAVLLLALANGCAARQAITGRVIDRNGDPIDRVIVSLDPGDVELITDSDGSFAIDYMRDEKGNRVRLERRRDYSVELFRLGYHVGETTVYYKRGELVVDPITLTEDTVRIEGPEVEVDPGQFRDRTQGTGATYEGE